ncbi:hypothetical protein [Mucilaginibacter paludis]|nr:hypothetical protein [Mucilaginibacter paludis]
MNTLKKQTQVNKIKTARSFHPQASSRPGVQSGFCALLSCAPNRFYDGWQ